MADIDASRATTQRATKLLVDIGYVRIEERNHGAEAETNVYYFVRAEGVARALAEASPVSPRNADRGVTGDGTEASPTRPPEATPARLLVNSKEELSRGTPKEEERDEASPSARSDSLKGTVGEREVRGVEPPPSPLESSPTSPAAGAHPSRASSPPSRASGASRRYLTVADVSRLYAQTPGGRKLTGKDWRHARDIAARAENMEMLEIVLDVLHSTKPWKGFANPTLGNLIGDGNDARLFWAEAERRLKARKEREAAEARLADPEVQAEMERQRLQDVSREADRRAQDERADRELPGVVDYFLALSRRSWPEATDEARLGRLERPRLRRDVGIYGGETMQA